MAPRKSISLQSGRIALFLGAFALLVILGYSVYAALPLLEGPALSVTATVMENSAVSISGITQRVSFLELNGAPISLQENGSFLVERAYPPGYTAITVTARDRFGKSITKKLSLITPNPSNVDDSKEETPLIQTNKI